MQVMGWGIFLLDEPEPCDLAVCSYPTPTLLPARTAAIRT
jgi:hypothetical protein